MKRKHNSTSQPTPGLIGVTERFPGNEGSQTPSSDGSRIPEGINKAGSNVIKQSITHLCWSSVLFSALLFISCGGGNETSHETGDAAGSLTIQVDVEYPAGAVTTGYRPSIAVYSAEDYNDFTHRPESMPIAALIGEEGDNSLSGLIMDFAQSHPYIFQPGEYSLVMGVAEASGMPSHVDGTPWLPVSVSLNEEGVELQISSDDERWRVE